MAQINLYYQTQLETKVSLLPHQLTGSIDDHLLANLKAKIEGRALDEGIIIRINRLIDYAYGIIEKTNFMGTTVYQIKYECFICAPIKDLEIICVVDNIIKGFLVARNGPIIVTIQFSNIDIQKFEINNNTIVYTKTKKPINKGDHVRASIIGIKNNLGARNIITACKLVGIADKDDVKKFEDDQAAITQEVPVDTTEFI